MSRLASLDILVVLGTIDWLIVAVWLHYRGVATATVLQLLIMAMNWGNR